MCELCYAHPWQDIRHVLLWKNLWYLLWTTAFSLLVLSVHCLWNHIYTCALRVCTVQAMNVSEVLCQYHTGSVPAIGIVQCASITAIQCQPLCTPHINLLSSARLQCPASHRCSEFCTGGEIGNSSFWPPQRKKHGWEFCIWVCLFFS